MIWLLLILLRLMRPKTDPPSGYKKGDCVYTIKVWHKNKWMYKVGFSRNFDQRMTFIQKSLKACRMSVKIHVVSVQYSKDALQKETEFHKKNFDKRAAKSKGIPKKLSGRNEWYYGLHNQKKQTKNKVYP